MVTTAMDIGGDGVGGIVPPGDEDYIQLQPPQIPPGWVAPQPQPHKVKLPPFWTQKPRIWFSHAEAVFSTFNVTEERTRFNLVLPCLSEEILTRVAAVVEAPEQLQLPYHALKQRLLEVYQPDRWESVHSLLHHRELGDLKPSQLMDAMLALLPAGEQPGLLFKGLWLERMPEVVRSHVQGAARLMDCRQLAAAADVVWLASNRPTGGLMPTAAVAPQPVHELADEVAALRLEKSGSSSGWRGGGRGRFFKKRGGQRGGQRSGQQRNSRYKCYRHAKFGQEAYSCEDPDRCSFGFQQQSTNGSQQQGNGQPGTW